MIREVEAEVTLETRRAIQSQLLEANPMTKAASLLRVAPARFLRVAPARLKSRTDLL